MLCKTCGSETGSNAKEHCGVRAEKGSCNHKNYLALQTIYRRNNTNALPVKGGKKTSQHEEDDLCVAALSSGYF